MLNRKKVLCTIKSYLQVLLISENYLQVLSNVLNVNAVQISKQQLNTVDIDVLLR